MADKEKLVDKIKFKGQDVLQELPFLSAKQFWDIENWEVLVNEWLELLLVENEELKKYPHSIIFPEVAKFVFYISKKMNLNNTEKYQTIDLFHRFNGSHVDSLVDYITSQLPSKSKKREILERAGAQCPLRITSCMQLALKMENHKVLSQKLRKILQQLGCRYSAKALGKSEFRVLEILQYRCNYPSSYLDYLNVFCAALEVNMKKKALKGLLCYGVYSTAIHLLNVTLLKHDIVYNALLKRIGGTAEVTAETRDALVKVANDRVLLIGAVMVAAAWLKGSDEWSDNMAHLLSIVTAIPETDLFTLASCILKYSVSISVTAAPSV